MAYLPDLIRFLDSYLGQSRYQDSAFNGLQVDSGRAEIQTIAFAVDAGESIFEKAVSLGAQLLIVHHGLFWGQALPAAGIHGRKLRRLMEGGCSLYASHLPLDGHMEVGNAAELARFFGLTTIEPFFELHGQTIGVRAIAAQEQSLAQFTEKAREIPGAREPLVLPFGPEKIRTVGIVTGSGTSALPLCLADNYDVPDYNGSSNSAEPRIDLFVSGEPKQEAYHLAKELGVNALFAGHYATETFGVRALQRRLEQEFDCRTEFIDEPTGI